MAKTSVDKLVSLILEEIKGRLSPDKPVFLSSWGDVMKFFSIGAPEQAQEIEMGEMANIKKIPRKLDTPLKLNINELDQSQSTALPKIVSLDPDTNEFVEDVIIGDEVITMPNGVEVLKFFNYGEEEKLDRAKKVSAYVVLPENIFYKHPPRNVKMGTKYVPTDLNIEPEGESEEERDARLKKLARQNEAYAKKYVIYPSINNFFSRRDILNRLDVSLVPETWAGPLRTERTTNKEIRFHFGGNGKAINIEFYAVRDLSSIEEALDEILKTRMDIEDGADVENRQRKRSSTKPREYANYIYTRGGNWDAIQRIYDEENFKQAGEYTRILKLLKQNIQKGQMGLNTFSKLVIDGDVSGNDYILRGKFDCTLNYRTVEKGTGNKAGEIVPPLYAEIRRALPPEVRNDPDFSIRKNKNFFGTRDGEGIFADLMKKLGDEMMTKINPDEVLNKIMTLLIPTNVSRDFLPSED